MSEFPKDFLYSNEAVIAHRCPFCSGVLEPKIGNIKCPECHAKFEYDDRMESIFVDTEDLRLPIKGNVCSKCGLLQDCGVKYCLYCGNQLSSTIQ